MTPSPHMSSHVSPRFVVGAYASLPAERYAQEEYYRLLGSQEWIDGTELPFPGDLAQSERRGWLARHLPAHWTANTVTMIPGTMQRIGDDATFGLAGADENGRKAALAQLADARDAIADLAQLRGRNDVAFIEIHTGPTGAADGEAMRRSLGEIASWEWNGTQPVIEHCDRAIAGRKPEKGFLPIETEIELCRDAGAGLTINWGRSCVEGRARALPAEHVRLAAGANVLAGLMFSGAGPEATQYGYAWIDGHLPMNPDEPTSWMGADQIAECVRLAASSARLAYIGTKICVPPASDLRTRAAMLAHIHDACAMHDVFGDGAGRADGVGHAASAGVADGAADTSLAVGMDGSEVAAEGEAAA